MLLDLISLSIIYLMFIVMLMTHSCIYLLNLIIPPCQAAVAATESCIRDIRQWLLHDRLMIIDIKSEFLIIGTRQQLQKINISNITVGESVIFPTTCVRNVGLFFDSQLTMNTHITKACSAAFFHLHNYIKRISKILSHDSLLTLIHAFVTSRLDYCNSLLHGLAMTQITKLQRVQNAAARPLSTPAPFNMHSLHQS